MHNSGDRFCAESPESSGRGGGQHHASLIVPNADRALAQLKERAAKTGYGRKIMIHAGVNRKRQLNLYDPDGTRIELMEPD